jgi:hypothetical protein
LASGRALFARFAARERPRLGCWRVFALLALTSTLTLAAFGRALGAGFVYDDEWTIVHNAHLEGPLGSLLLASWKGEAKRLKIPDATRPGMVASTWIDRRLFGTSPWGYHAHSLALHGLASALAGLCVFALTRRRRLALLAAALFATAPIHAEVVAAVNNREDLIAALGVFGALTLVFWPPARDEARTQSPCWRAAVATGLPAAFWLVGLCAKETAIVLVPIAAVAWVFERRRRSLARDREPMLLALLAVGIIWMSWRVGLHFGADDIPTVRGMGFAERLFRTARYLAWAAAGQIVPLWPAPEYGRLGPASVAWLAVVACLAALAVFLARRRATRVPALGLAMVLLAPLATSPLVGPINERADRYLYLGTLGGALIWSFILDRAAAALPRHVDSGNRRASERALVGLAVVVGGACAALSARAAAVWHDEMSLWTEATRVAPDSPRAWAGLSHAKRLAGHMDEALELSQRALEIDPTYPPAHLTHAYNLLGSGRRDEALSEIEYVQEHAPDLPGLAHGVGCASRPTPEEAAACIDPH